MYYICCVLFICVLAAPTRRAIFLLVASQSMIAGVIAANFDTARPTVSKHITNTHRVLLLKQEQNGREIYYHINAKKMKDNGTELMVDGGLTR
ncbi:MAG: hypothetical protein JWQ85_501 [Mucilaginibacter sp.]|nr:hypothetical protein [Mucilaginibacter sp.]